MKYRNLIILCALCLLNGFSETSFGQTKEPERSAGDSGSSRSDDSGRGRGGYGRFGGRGEGGRGEGRDREGRGGDSRGGDSRGSGSYQRDGGYRGGYQRAGESDSRGGDSRSSDLRSGDNRGGDARSYQSQPAVGPDGKSIVRRGAARVGTQKTSASLTLPSQYLVKDTNRDGQIAVYEWSQSDLSTFRKLDLNGDGFIIPSEFANPGRASAGGTIASSIPSGAIGGQEKSSGPAADPYLAEVEKNFGLWDTNKNGQLEQDEFDNTIRAQRVFEKAKVKFEGPMLKDKFVETYMAAVKTKSS